jgi:hypothetical protein
MKKPAVKATKKTAKTAPTKEPVASVATLQGAPEDWNAETSLEHWFPDPATLAEVRARAKAAARTKMPAQQKKAWAQVAALFPPALARVIGDTPWRWGSVPSPRVAEEAMRLIAAAPSVGTVAEVRAIEADLERILPEVPALCLSDIVGQAAYLRAYDAVDTAAVARATDALGWALADLRAYLSTT